MVIKERNGNVKRLSSNYFKYTEVREIGSGTFGKVIEAKYNKERYAVKTFTYEKEAYHLTTLREIKALRTIKSPYVLEIRELIVEKFKIYLVFDFYEYDLYKLIGVETFTLCDIRHVFWQILKGVEAIHNSGFLHRDLKTANILINKRLRPESLSGTAQGKRPTDNKQVSDNRDILQTSMNRDSCSEDLEYDDREYHKDTRNTAYSNDKYYHDNLDKNRKCYDDDRRYYDDNRRYHDGGRRYNNDRGYYEDDRQYRNDEDRQYRSDGRGYHSDRHCYDNLDDNRRYHCDDRKHYNDDRKHQSGGKRPNVEKDGQESRKILKYNEYPDEAYPYLLSEYKVNICDFGMARQKSKEMSPGVVTLWYRSPELLLGSTVYSKSIDIWSLGCILLEFFKRKPVFKANTEIEELEMVVDLCGSINETSFPGCTGYPLYSKYNIKEGSRCILESFSSFSATAADLADKMLKLNPKDRISIEAIFCHPFFTESLP